MDRTDYEGDLKAAFENVMQQLDDYQHTWSGWVLDQFLELDVSISTYAQFMGKDIDEDEDDYDEKNEESGELWKTTNLWNFVNELTIQAMIQV